MNPVTLTLDRLPTPVGVMSFMTDEEDRLRVLDWSDYEDRTARLLRRHYGPAGVVVREARTLSAARRALEAYLDGDLTAIDGVVVECGGTAFQKKAWAALRTIPAGQTLSYGAQAALMGLPKAVRAVGLANGANPIGVVVPCHRVIGANGSLTGYGGGMERKRWLLRHEGALLA